VSKRTILALFRMCFLGNMTKNGNIAHSNLATAENGQTNKIGGSFDSLFMENWQKRLPEQGEICHFPSSIFNKM